MKSSNNTHSSESGVSCASGSTTNEQQQTKIVTNSRLSSIFQAVETYISVVNYSGGHVTGTTWTKSRSQSAQVELERV